jgi:ABC-type antimicrobial peptide transport system permease subunit
MILRQTGAVAATGVFLGVLGGVIASALVRSFLCGIRPVEWTVFAAVALTMGLVTVLTAYSAARPWLRSDPMESVRHA